MTPRPLSDDRIQQRGSCPLHSHPPIVDQRKFWNDHWQQRQERRTHNAWELRRNQTILELLRSLRLRSPRILDLGCGPGWFTETFAQFGEVTGIDLSDEAIATAAARAPHVHFIAGDLYRTDLPLRHFDVVVSQEVLGHVENQVAYIDRAAAVLRPGGYLLLATPNRFVLDRLGDTAWASYPAQHIDDHVDRHGLRRLLTRRFRVVRMTTILPIGRGGILRLINSVKLTRALAWLISERRLTSFKEWAGFGYQIVVLAQKPDARTANRRESL